MPQAVRFDRYGGIDVLDVVEVEPQAPGEGEVLVRVKAAGINPGEASIRKGGCTSAGRRRSRRGRAATSPASSRRSGRASTASPSATR